MPLNEMLMETGTTRRRYQQIADKLAESIRSEDTKPGQRLPSERDLASRFGVSRQTIREALIALEVAGVVEIRLGSGIYVQPPSTKSESPIEYENAPGPLEILEARKVVESEAAALAAERISNEELQQLQAILSLMNDSSVKRQTREAENQDRQFHLLIADASRNSAISSMVAWLWKLRSRSEISRFFHETVRAQGSEPNIEDHQLIHEALVRRNSDGARKAMANHITRVYQEYSEFSLGGPN